ncbi:MAG: DNA methyltransferase, partial [Desulfuromonadales bacterium]|nr:DNA methyltransferase [Desulfuromonadales bacterium]
RVMDFPKPVGLVCELIQQATNSNDLILDFFAGSGTTGHAVMNLNNEDNGNRKFILVQIPELTDEKSEAFKAGYKKISDITIERNKRVIDRIAQGQTEKQQQGLFEQGQEAYQPGFKTYRLVKSHFPRVEFQPDPEQTTEENIALLKQYIIDKEATLYSLFNEADIFDEVMLKNGFQLSYSREALAEFTANSVYRVTDGHKTALVCLDPELNDATVATLNGRDEIFICLERAVDTTKKWNLKHQLGEKLVAF